MGEQDVDTSFHFMSNSRHFLCSRNSYASFILKRQQFINNLKGASSKYKDLIEPLYDPQSGHTNMVLPLPGGLGTEHSYQEKGVFGEITERLHIASPK